MEDSKRCPQGQRPRALIQKHGLSASSRPAAGQRRRRRRSRKRLGLFHQARVRACVAQPLPPSGRTLRGRPKPSAGPRRGFPDSGLPGTPKIRTGPPRRTYWRATVATRVHACLMQAVRCRTGGHLRRKVLPTPGAMGRMQRPRRRFGFGVRRTCGSRVIRPTPPGYPKRFFRRPNEVEE